MRQRVCIQRRDGLKLAVLLGMFTFLAILYNATSPPFEAPDEVGHFYYIVHLLETAQLPVVPATGPAPHYEHEGIQAPLYYVSAALFVKALSAPLNLDLTDARKPIAVNPHSNCGQPGAQYNALYFSHDPHAERFPYTGRIRVLHVARLWSTVWAALAVAGVFVATRLAAPDRPLAAWLAASITVFTPEFLFSAAAVTNDTVVTGVSAWGLVFALRVVKRGFSLWHIPLMGVVAGLGALSKFSGIALLPLFLSTMLIRSVLDIRPNALHSRADWWRLIAHVSMKAGLMSITFLAVAGWWLYRNWRLYGDPSGTNMHLALLPTRDHMTVKQLLLESPGLFRSWWGVFGCTTPLPGFYLPYLGLTIAGLAGFLIAHRRKHFERGPTVILFLWLALLLVAYIRWNWAIHAAKGRLLFPAMPSIAGPIGIGLAEWTSRRRWLASGILGAMSASALTVPFTLIAPTAAPPPIYPDPALVAPDHRMAGQFGRDIALIGYDLEKRSFEPGEALSLTLYWHALSHPKNHFSVALQLVSAIPGDTTTLINFNTWPGRGNYPTGNWHPGDVIVDPYTLRLPPDVKRAQAWLVQVVVFDRTTGRRLPFELNGAAAGDAAVLKLVRVGASDPTVHAPNTAEKLANPPRFGNAITLEGLRITGQPDQLLAKLWWHSISHLDQDVIVFLHFYDAEGHLLATADGPPLSGGFPVPLWEPGDWIVEERAVELGGNTFPTQIGLGWYDPVTGVRLPATNSAGFALSDDEYRTKIAP